MAQQVCDPEARGRMERVFGTLQQRLNLKLSTLRKHASQVANAVVGHVGAIRMILVARPADPNPSDTSNLQKH